MFVYSQIHNWQNDEAVKQILVFPSQLLKDEFEKTFAERVEKDGIDKVTDSNAGSVYKIRAIKNGNNKWDGCVRCGSSGELLIDKTNLGDNWESAIVNIVNIFNCYIQESCRQMFSFVMNESRKEPTLSSWSSIGVQNSGYPYGNTQKDNAGVKWSYKLQKQQELQPNTGEQKCYISKTQLWTNTPPGPEGPEHTY